MIVQLEMGWGVGSGGDEERQFSYLQAVQGDSPVGWGWGGGNEERQFSYLQAVRGDSPVGWGGGGMKKDNSVTCRRYRVIVQWGGGGGMKKDNSVTCRRYGVIVQAVASEDSIGQQRGGPGQRDGGGGGVEGHRLHRACRCTHR